MSQSPSVPPPGELVAAKADANTLITRATYKLFMLFIMLLSLAVTAIYYLAPVPDYTRDVLFLINIINSTILLFDFVVRLVHAPSKWRYLLPWGLLDLLGSLPGIPWLRLLRIPWLVTTLRELRHTTRRDILETAGNRLAESTLLSGIIAVFFVITVGGTAMVWVEAPAPGSNIRNGGDAVWYAIVTISTVGYGDFYPVTFPGRMIGSVMIVVGVSIFSVLTGYISTQFLDKRKRGPHDIDQLRRDIESLFEVQGRQAAADRAALEQQIADLRARLAQRGESE